MESVTDIPEHPPEHPSETPSQKPSLKRRIIKWSLWSLLAIVLLVVGTGAGLYFFISEDLPKITRLTDYNPPLITTVYSDDGRVIGEFYRERRILLPLERIPKILTEAFIAAEDARFYKHKGIDVISIFRAFIKNVEAGTIVQGGSTITQQVTKSFFLTPERSYERKLKEAILAYRIDKAFTKQEILYLYLNQIYLGHGAYGVQAAAQNYFGKSADELNLAECAVLAGLPQAPSKYSPFRFPERARQRQIYVLNRMVTEGYITNLQATEAINTELDIRPRRNYYREQVPAYTEHVRKYVESKYGAEMLYTGGLRIYTAVNVDMQQVAREETTGGLSSMDKRLGYRGSLARLTQDQMAAFTAEQSTEPLAPGAITKALVTTVNNTEKTVGVALGHQQGVLALEDMAWARRPNPEVPYYAVKLRRPGRALRVGDVIMVRLLEKPEGQEHWRVALEQEAEAEAALLCIEAETGHVKVMVGGRDFKSSQFNRAVQSRRQPGSAFKPMIYAAALDKGYTSATVIIDSPIVFEDSQTDFTWKPKNYGEKFYGPTLFRKAMALSRNVITVKILQDIGIDYAINYSRRLGISSDLSRDLSIALGSSGVSLLEIVNAYSVFANQGYLVDPVFVLRIEDREGNILEEAQPKRQRVIEKSTAYIMTSLLEGVVQTGTGRRVRALGRPAAGKTGTTNNLNDAWFVGYTPRYVTGVWVGYDDKRSLGVTETGSRAASPIWLGFMKRVLEGKSVRIFQVPEGVVFSRIDAETGLLPIPESKETIFECFKEGTVPIEYTRPPDAVTNPEQFFKSDL